MLRYSETDEMAAGGRVIPLQYKGSCGAGRGTTSQGPAGRDLVAPLLIDLRRPDEGPVLIREPRSAVPQQERRAVGRLLGLFGHALDCVSLITPLVVAGLLRPEQRVNPFVIVLFGLVGMVLLWPTARRGRLVVVPSEGLVNIAARVALAPIATLVIVSLAQSDSVLVEGKLLNVLAVVWIIVATIPFILLGRIITYRLVKVARSRGYDLEDTLIIGTGPVALEIAQSLADNPEFGLVPCGFVDRYDDAAPLPVVGRPEHLPEILRLTRVGHVILAFGAADDPELVGIVRRCHNLPVQFYAVPRLFELGVSADDICHELSGLPLIPLRRPDATSSSWRAKRALDVVASAGLIMLVSPILVGCALAVKFTSRGPIFFRQVRVGLGGRPFEILKFRTMKVNDDSATQWSVQGDDRVTSVGRFLRPSHLDELPQLFNVLRGDMSLVGPRPERPHFVEQFGEEIDSYHFRHRVPVGLTGWAQVNGYWGDTSIETRVRLDNRYIENWSLWRDLLIGLRTIPTLLGKHR